MEGLPRAYTPKPIVQRLIGIAFIIAAICALSFGVYYGMGWIRTLFPDAPATSSSRCSSRSMSACVYISSKETIPELTNEEGKDETLPLPGPTVRSGLHFILPVVVLVWALMVDRLSPGLSAFWAAAFMIFILLTQRPLLAMFRGEGQFGTAFRNGCVDLLDGLVTGARNMIGIGIATATAGIIVGAVSQTGVGSALADVVEVLSGGNILAILFLTAILSLILGMGLPTTANYIVVSALLAPVIVTLGQQNGLIVPLIAVHLFVFYFGIMADVTPPVGLASFAAAAVSGGDPIKTGVVAFFYSLAHRGTALPLHLQHRAPADRCRVGAGHIRLHRRDGGHAALRGGDAGLVPGQEPLLRDDRASADRLHLVPARRSGWTWSIRPSSRCRPCRSRRPRATLPSASRCACASRA